MSMKTVMKSHEKNNAVITAKILRWDTRLEDVTKSVGLTEMLAMVLIRIAAVNR